MNATFEDFKVGNILFINYAGDGVIKITVISEPYEIQAGWFFDYKYIDGNCKFENYDSSSLGDHGIHDTYDSRPCMIFTTESAAIEATDSLKHWYDNNRLGSYSDFLFYLES